MTAARALLDLPLRRPAAVLVAAALVTAGLGAGLARLRIDSSVESMMMADDPERAAFDAWKAVFGSDEVVAIAIPFEDDALTPGSLAVQRRLAERLEALPEVREVEALATADDVLGTDDSLVVEPLLPVDRHPGELGPEEVARIRERVEANPIWTGLLISRDRTTAALQVHLLDPGESGADRGRLLARIEAIAREELMGRPFHLAGHPYMKAEIARTMQRDLSVLLPVTLGVMAVFLVAGVRSRVTAALLLGGTLLAVTWMLGAMAWLGQPLTALSNAAPTILLALATATFMHVAAAYQKQAAAGGSPAEVVGRALEHMRRPTAVACLTTAIGFGSLGASRIPLVQGFGIYVATGILAALAIACTVLPAALVLVAPVAGETALARGSRLGRTLFGISRFDALGAPWILAAAVLLVVGGFTVATRLEIDSSGPKAFARDAPFRVSSEFYRDRLSGDVVENVYLDTGAEGGVKDPDFLRRLRVFQRDAEALPQVDKTLSIADVVARMNRAMHGDRPEQDRIPATRNAVAQYLLLYSFSGDLEEFDELVDPSFTQARIVLNATVESSRESAALRSALEQLAARHFPREADATSVLSTEILLSKAADSLAREQSSSFGGALVLILLVIGFAFRSVAVAALMVLPNGLPIALNFGMMALVGMSLSQSTALFAAIALGMAIDSTVHLLESIRRSRREHGSLGGAVVEALQTSGRPVAVTSSIVVAGFSVLLLSDFRMIAELGGLTAFAMLSGVFADLVVLPAQLFALESAVRARTAAPAALLGFGQQVVPALLVADSGDKAAFRLLGEEAAWRGLGETPVQVRWLAGGLREGRIIGLEHASDPVVRVEWTGR